MGKLAGCEQRVTFVLPEKVNACSSDFNTDIFFPVIENCTKTEKIDLFFKVETKLSKDVNLGRL